MKPDNTDSLKTISVALQPIVNQMQEVQNSVTVDWSQIKRFQEALSSISPHIKESVRRISEAISPFILAIQDVLGQFKDAITKFALEFPVLSEDRKEQLRISYEKWGQLGWTQIPNAPVNLFANYPSSSAEANQLAMQYCKAFHLRTLFSDLREQKLNKFDLEEAIFCFESKRYKACALILFGLIDAKMIREQRSNRRCVGAGAVKNLKLQFTFCVDNYEQTLFLLMDYINLFACFEMLFYNAYDFRNEPSTVNRNYISHGMNSRRVRKKDCIQLFIALYNLVEFLEIF